MRIDYHDKFIRLHSSCIPVKGAMRSIICDLQNMSFDFIPNELFEMLQLSDLSAQGLVDRYGEMNKEVIIEYIEFLLEREYCFLCSEKELAWFPKAATKWESAIAIENCIIDVDGGSDHDWDKLFSELNHLKCTGLQIRVYSALPLDNICFLVQKLSRSTIRNLELLLPYPELPSSEEDLDNLADADNRINFLFVHSSPRNKKYYSPKGKPIFLSVEPIKDKSHCGIISPSFFSVNRNHFTESLKFNTCLNKKISVDVKGEIRNCPSMEKSYGNTRQTTLVAALNKHGFKDLWQVNKDQIEGCKVCEFRHICSDCRAYKRQPENINSKPLKCGYDPLNAKWEDWAINPLNKKGIEYYGFSKLR